MLGDYCTDDAKSVLAVSMRAWEWSKGKAMLPKTAKAHVSCHFLTRRFLLQTAA
jgi:hypothetical protein